ncbi:hypothetical protein [Haladaptatus caseinilyticus]|uniref:hypothetical protein n=1 Tax=Haladaptatus caseinilyticus TaxID=2993314 RepID=UPI00224AB957|nr:hypothetical protein [Haladaptatus caseinilyticus]
MDVIEKLRQTVDHCDDARWWRRIALPFLYEKAVLKPYYRYVHGHTGSRVMFEDWDNLLILDACRFDVFHESLTESTLSGTLTRKRSLGSNTPEFLRRNFDGRTFRDTVYVTANPQVNVHTDDTFHAVVNVWESDWDESHNTVHPREMVRKTLETRATYPNKRIIAHFIQPHYPFIGEFGQEAIEQQAGIELSRRMATGEMAESDHWNVWDMLKQGYLREDVVRTAYRENLEITLPHVETLQSSLNGKTVVTSDHGNLFGERIGPLGVPVYGHPEGIYATDLVTVPWLELDYSQRRDVTSGTSSERRSESNDRVMERLEQLGYR